jgi:hypothetical protein
LSDYDVVQDLTNDELKSLPTGSIVKLRINGTDTVCVTWRSSDGRFYAIQDRHAGSTDDYSSEWTKYGRYSWVIDVTSEYSGIPQLLVLKGIKIEKPQEDLDDKVDPYTWNAPLSMSRYGGVSLGRDSNMAKYLSNAHFAIVLNFLDLKDSEFQKKQDINKEREERKVGAMAFMDDEEIKRKNIQRYIDEISKKMAVSDDLKQLSSTISKFLGGPYSGLYVLRGRNASEFQNFVSYIYRGISSEDDRDKKNYIEAATNSLRDVYERNLKFNADVTDSTKQIYQHMKSNNREEYKPLLDKLMEVNKSIVNKIKSFEIENIEDMEALYEKINSIRNIYRNSERFQWSRKMYYVTEHYTNVDRSLGALYDINTSDIPKVLDQLNKLERVIERL